MFVCGDTSWFIYIPIFPIFHITKIFSILITSSLSFLCIFVRLFYKLSSSGSSDYVPHRRNEIRSILGDDCLLSSVQIEGQIRLKDTTFFVGLGYAFCLLSVCL